MSQTGSARDELEAVIWVALARGFSMPAGISGAEAVRRDRAFVDTILDAADAYAVEALEDTEDTPRATARRRDILGLATADLYTPNSQHQWRAS